MSEGPNNLSIAKSRKDDKGLDVISLSSASSPEPPFPLRSSKLDSSRLNAM